MDLSHLVSPSNLFAGAIAAAISALVTGLLEAIFGARQRYYFERELEKIKHSYELDTERMRHDYQLDLEKVRSQLRVDTDLTRTMVERRLAAYSGIIETVYRTHNLARALAHSPQPNPVVVGEFGARAQELTDSIFTHRLDLELNQVFSPMHKYKGMLQAFMGLITDLQVASETTDTTPTDDPAQESLRRAIDETFAELETQHRTIIDLLTKQIDAASLVRGDTSKSAT